VRRLLADQTARLDVRIEDDLPADLKTPPMFPAEVGVMLTNLLTNAVKNAGSPGIVRVAGATLGVRGATLFIHNTGVAVDLEEAERWFLPFESTTVEVNEVLGQGLGLGLPITRALVEDYRGTIRFVTPPPGFATSIRVDLPDPQERR
jgi:signal transduction histidine kinase